MKHIYKFLLLFLIQIIFLPNNLFAQNKLQKLKVADNNRYLCYDDGTPFFWLADTAWEIFLKLNTEEASLYFEDRSSKGFNVIQCTILSENDFHTIDATNQYGQKPLINGDPEKPDTIPGKNNDYWDYIDKTIKLAESKGLYIGLLPTWGEYVTTEFRDGIVNSIFDVDNAFIYGKFVGERYKNYTNIIWILGGDRSACTKEAKAIWRSLAKGLATGLTGSEDYSKMLMTFHPVGKRHSTDDFPGEKWIDFNAIQSGHGTNILNWKMIQNDYNNYKNTPVIDLESSYPFLGENNNKEKTDFYARRAAYWSVFSGSFGHTYGHHGIWNFVKENENKNIIWKNAIQAVSSTQMGYLKNLIKSFPFFERIPDQNMIASNPGLDTDHIAATRGNNYALIYIPTGRPVAIRMGHIKGESVKAKWFNPGNNKYSQTETKPNSGLITFIPPNSPSSQQETDWVLILESVEN
ncbi:glycoside hydrolase family 140 protein [Maribellus maritimus]|uniref:glycoside hydrolase family 140 protein n=1 Tax=Maribellus maritimus TaxID=2870838 RepID=UPI001EEAB4F3|nr:glycoside hydrolase family 140 protein [Maribellus maritimus]MCG6186187.1 glycoside hydrolase family 140 protein [Maribellus maritimus]